MEIAVSLLGRILNVGIIYLELRVPQIFKLSFLVILTLSCCSAWAESWKPVTGTENIKGLFSDTKMTATLENGVTATASYNSDGSGELRAWGDAFERQWRVENDKNVCLLIDNKWDCFSLEQNTENKAFYRATNISTKQQITFTVSGNDVVVKTSKTVDQKQANKGGAVKPSADEVAAKLANPNTPLASLSFKFQYREFEGDLPNADNQDGMGLIFQPSLPFPLANGDLILFRPAIPIQFDQPTFDSSELDFDGKSGLGDISFDLAYTRTTKSGTLIAGGLFSTVPTATEDELGQDRWTLGPEFLLGKITKKYVIGAFPNHQWDIAGSGDADISLTSMQLFYVHLPGGGWNLGTSPTMSYNHESDESTIPLNFNFGKTLIMRGRPWKVGAEFNYFVEKPDAFGPDWIAGINIAPVVENPFARWFK